VTPALPWGDVVAAADVPGLGRVRLTVDARGCLWGMREPPLDPWPVVPSGEATRIRALLARGACLRVRERRGFLIIEPVPARSG